MNEQQCLSNWQCQNVTVLRYHLLKGGSV